MSLDHLSLRERIWNAIPDQKKPKKETFLKKVNMRSKWGYEELKAPIRYTDREGIGSGKHPGVPKVGAMAFPNSCPPMPWTGKRRKQ